MKSLLYAAVLVAAVAIVPILSHVVLAQDTSGFDRNLCIQNCAWLKPYGYNYGQYSNYYNCMAGCESRFWKDFDRNSRDLEKQLDKE
ncbi:MAG TPA: hypothetical protein VMC85_17860 [Desulfomonilaceae bacterium]|nr:hypothetical protein [Desulfomonilaceae bacterium]